MTSSVKIKLFNLIKPVLIMLFWLAVWEAAALIVDNALFVPAPVTVLSRLLVLCREAAFWKSVGISVVRIIFGLLLGITVGTLLAVLCAVLPIEPLTSPLLTVIKATPVASIIMLAWILLKRDSIPTFIAALIVIPIVFGGLNDGISSVKKQYDGFIGMYKLSKRQSLIYVYLPGVLPQFSTSVLVCAGIVWKAGIAAEVLCQPDFSIGAELFYAKTLLETTDVFAWTLVVIIISLILEKTLKLLLKRVAKW